MGSFLFRWTKPAEEVFVTGTFDNWSKSVQLEKQNGGFEKQVELPYADQKIFYKFVVDGNWTTDSEASVENDLSGNANNVLTPENITKMATDGSSSDTQNPAASVISGIGPSSSTVERAGQVPLEKDIDSNDDKMPGAFPDPTPVEEGTYTPIDLFPGDMVPDYSTYFSSTIPSKKSNSDSSAARDPNEQSFGVNPIPASGGYGNPVKLEPGQSVPPSGEVTSSTVDSNARTDKNSYEKSDSAAPFSSLSSAGTAVGGAAAAGVAGVAGAFGLAGKSDKTVPESSLPMGEGASNQEIEQDEGPMIRSAAGTDTSTSQLASQVPLEPRGVPQVIQDSQGDANTSSTTAPSADDLSKDTIMDKREMEDELKSKVTEDQPTSENKGMIAGAAAGAGAAAVGGLAYASSKAGVPQSIQDKISSMNTDSQTPADDIPRPVAESYERSTEDPEAVANPEAVSEKKDMEKELLQDVKTTNQSGEPAPVMSAEQTSMAPGTGAGVVGDEKHGLSSSTGAGIAAGAVGAAGLGASALGASALSSSSGSSSRIQNPSDVPSTDPNVMIADSDTMPAISVANREAVPPSEANSADTSAPLADRSAATGSYSTQSSQMPATAITTDRSVPASSAPTASSTSAGSMSSAQAVAARVLGAPQASSIAPTGSSSTTTSQAATRSTSGGVFDNDPISAPGTSATAATSTSSTSDPRTTAPAFANDPISSSDASTGAAAASRVSGGVFDNDPVSATGTSAPVTTSTSSTMDPRTTASAFANDPISSTDTPTSSGATSAGASAPIVAGGPAGAAVPMTNSSTTGTTSTTGTSSGLNAPASMPAQSIATESKQLASSENVRPQDTTPGAPANTTAHATTTSSSTQNKAQTSGGALSSAFGPENKGRQISRDVSPFSREAAAASSSSGPTATTGTSTGKAAAKQTPGTPAKAGGASAAGASPAGASSAAASSSAAQSGTPESSKSSKRRSRLGQWFSEHVGSERKGKK